MEKWGLLLNAFQIAFEIRLNNLNEFFEQGFVFHGDKFFYFLTVFLGFDDFHDIEVYFFLVVSVVLVVMVTVIAVATALAILLGVTQDNVLFTVVKEIAHNFQENFVSILIQTFDEVLVHFVGGCAAQGLVVIVQWNRPSLLQISSGKAASQRA